MCGVVLGFCLRYGVRVLFAVWCQGFVCGMVLGLCLRYGVRVLFAVWC